MDTTETTSGTTATLDAESSSIMAAAMQADRGEYTPPEKKETADTPDNSNAQEADGDLADQGSDETETQSEQAPAKKPEAEKKPEAAKPTDKPESAFAKAQKEKARFEGVRKKFHEEQAALRAEKAKFEQERAEFQRLRTQPPETKPNAAATPTGPGPEVFEELAKKYDVEGETGLAAAARTKATELRAQAQQTATAEQAQQPAKPADPAASPQFKTEWNGHVADLVKQHPHLNDPANPVGQATMGLINHGTYGRFFRAHPDGIKMAHEVALLQAQAGKTAALEKDLTTAKAEVDRLTKLTGIRGGPPPSGAPAPKALGDLSGPQAEDFVRSMAMKADGGG